MPLKTYFLAGLCLSALVLTVGSVANAVELNEEPKLQLIAAELTGFATALGLIRHHHVEVMDFMTLLRQSALYAPTFDAKLPRFESGDFDQHNLPARLLLKDLELAKDVADDLGLQTSALEGLCEVVRDVVDRGLANSDYSVIASVVDPHH